MKNIFLLLFLFIISVEAFPQLQLGISSSGGISNVIIENRNSNNIYGNYFTPRPCSSIGIFTLEKTPNNRISFEQGFYFETVGTRQNIPVDKYEDMKENIPGFSSPQNWPERSLGLTVPLKVKYQFEKWLVFQAGISNTFYLYKIVGNDYTISNLYAFRGEVGADFLLGKKIFAGINYSQDLTPCGKMTIDQNYFYFQSLSLRIGYILK